MASGLEIEFDEADKQHLLREQSLRQRKNQPSINYDAEELRTLQGKRHSVYKSTRTAFPSSWPSLSLWALEPKDPNDTECSSRMTKQRVTKFVYELIASLIFVWFVIFSVWVKVDVTQGTFTGIPWFLSIQSLYTGWVQAFGLGLALVACGWFSAEINSTYTLITGLFPKSGVSIGANMLTALIKIIGQHIGAFAGALLAIAVLGDNSYPGGSGTSGGIPGVPGNPLGFGFSGVTIYQPTTTQAWVFEFLGSFMLGLLMMIIQFNPASTLTKHPHLTLPFTLLALVVFGCPISGAVFNWTRYFGQAIVAIIAGGTFGPLWWLYLTAPAAGHAVAALFYIFIFRF